MMPINAMRLRNGIAAPTDPFYANVSLLLHCDGTNGSTSFPDNSPTPKTVTPANNAVVTTSNPLFGTGCVLLDGGDDYLSTPDHADFEFGNGDFCIEVSVRFGTLTANNLAGCFIAKYDTDSAGKRSWFFYDFNNSGAYELYFTYSTDGTSTVNKFVSWSPAINTWYRLCVSRQGTDLRFFVDGTQIGAAQSVGTDTLFNGTSLVRVGAQFHSSPQYEISGRMDEIRVTKGQARRTASYTPDSVAFPNS